MSMKPLLRDVEINSPERPSDLTLTEDDLKLQIVCPAALAFSDQASYPACVCRVDNSTVRIKTSPNSFKKWCTDDYQMCPAWRLKKERERQAQGKRF